MPSPISSPQNFRIKAAAKLRERKERNTQQLFLIDGLRECQCAWQAKISFTEFFVHEALPRTLALESWLDELEQANVPVYVTSSVPFEKIAFGERDCSVVAVAKSWNTELNTLQVPEKPLFLIVEGIEKPGNLGAMLRTASAVGVNAVVATGLGTDWFNPNTVRASLGALFSVPVCYAAVETLVPWLKEHDIKIFAARVNGSVNYTTVNYRDKCAIVVGSEAEGLSSHWNNANSTAISLPMQGAVDSLNVSVSAAVICYEALRQRMLGKGAV
jgi:RNA methyltransferase, TrmH family